MVGLGRRVGLMRCEEGKEKVGQDGMRRMRRRMEGEYDTPGRDELEEDCKDIEIWE